MASSARRIMSNWQILNQRILSTYKVFDVTMKESERIRERERALFALRD